MVIAVMLATAAGCSSGREGDTGGANDAGAPAAAEVATIDTGLRMAGVSASPDGRFAHAAGQDEIAVVDLTAAKTIDTIGYAPGPRQIRFSGDGSRAYVASGTINGGVGVIDTASRRLTGIIPVDGGPLYGLALAPDGLRGYSANSGAGAVVVDLKTRAVQAIPLPRGERGGVAMSPDGRYAYFTTDTSLAPRLPGPRSVNVLDTSGNTISATITVNAERPHEVAISPDGRRLYVAHFPSSQDTPNAVSLIDTAAGAITGTIPVKGRSTGLALSPDGRRLHVLDESGTLQTVETATGVVVTTVQVGSPTNGLALAPDGRKAYVAGDTTLHVINLG
ncbi:hypothetical protein [Amycolatopsis sp. MEPSY49]|uniref:hypothetical protein n=1 Tax=Amycolatopsis sp. MEPSY49 TaxID=3151600 RepID=UPI003EF6E960